MKIRLMGLPAEVHQAVIMICDAEAFDVIQVDGPYPNRGDSRIIRIYIEAHLRADRSVTFRTWADVKTRLFAGRDEELRVAEEQLRDEVCPYCEDPDRWP
jgi:hypothetical protein